MSELRHARWRRSSYSGTGNNCVEVARVAGQVAVRDSKNPAMRPVILSAETFRELTRRLLEAAG